MHFSFSFPSSEVIQNRLNEDRRLTAILTGIGLGASAVILGILLAIGGPLLAIAVIFGVAVGLYVLTNLMAGLYLMVAVIALMPYGTLPVKIAVTPTFLDMALVGFLIVYLFQWMTGRRSDFRVAPIQAMIVGFVMFMLFSFVAGLSYSPPTVSVLRKFTEMVLSILFSIVLVDAVRDTPTVRRLVLALIVAGSVQGVIGVILALINPTTAERVLDSLGRFGYPVGGVVRYVNDDPTLAERAVGTWVDPNSYGGFLMLAGMLTCVQAVAKNPVTGRRWIAVLLLIPMLLALYLTRSRSSQIALVAGLLFVALMRYRWLILVLVVSISIVLVLPSTRDDVQRFIDGLTAQDLSTQMRLGEYKDALTLIERYPIIGVGFSGTPDRDIYLAVADVYLTIADNMGLLGLVLYLIMMAEIFRYGLWRWRKIKLAPNGLSDLWLGFAAGLVGAMVQGIFDHFYFHMEFQSAVTLFWLFVGLALACAKIAEHHAMQV